VNCAEKSGIFTIQFGMITTKRRCIMAKKRSPSILLQENGILYDQLEFVTADPQGSYTGRPDAPWERPVQDADDL
jgi:hypothetical protein